MSTPILDLRDRLATIEDLKAASSVLAWDQETYLPSGGVESRAAQLATLQRVIHESFTSEAIGELIDRSRDSDDLPDNDEQLLRVVKREYDRATRLPTELVARFAETTAKAMAAWSKARQDSSFEAFRPHLQTIIELSREKADALDIGSEPYDSLLDEFEPGMTTAEVETAFRDLREQLVPIVETIASREGPSSDPLHQRFDEQKQWGFGLSVIRDFGFDFERGRQDRSAHPFTIHFSSSDVRITTRVDEDFFSPAFFGTLHEAGHGMYEQGVDSGLARSPLAQGTSLGMHESQSRLWENQIGRSLAFWRGHYPKLQSVFPDQLSSVSLESFYGAINHVQPSLIRVEADEVTYNLHVMLRFELERSLLNDELAVADLPAAWNDGMMEYLGVTPSNDAEGVLQDIHWSMGAIGYFPTYSLGTLMSAQIFAAANGAIPDLDQAITRGDFKSLLKWLTDHIYRHGRALDAREILLAVTGSELDSSQWLAYIRGKFGGIYGELP
jgi:carboxypeptidase Taq